MGRFRYLLEVVVNLHQINCRELAGGGIGD